MGTTTPIPQILPVSVEEIWGAIGTDRDVHLFNFSAQNEVDVPPLVPGFVAFESCFFHSCSSLPCDEQPLLAISTSAKL